MRLATVFLSIALLGFAGCGLVRAVFGGASDAVTQTESNKPPDTSPWFYLMAYAVSREAVGQGVNILRARSAAKKG
jgi:hypothetical protein